ncbi:2-dehydro-3-deoxyphosphogluconate aldolase / (4S)-4-hydroxy-2-oxoglutarate aldolase [Halobacillus karajensis]|uniref:KHG/KDPG aldolase n=1 Tax=Halobacillus karajensis TaxID=195088 RepID=A0A059NXA1_9BACI|nr:bifunctional 4-hydroxy-2-oxoglutarate aldolase/2-dehydro-3-deoxy-phosphogluconate aldolase [Halobacillus karajensis]CDQ18523.1 KHG/KDPG aldolase [Halobacillus karajensis]CDQ23405.1 KHG/KDPG aldolase [Halobacillus karajensis]CDQ26887.1 KHG/KDPG aldolase [Halobacillus karajensis]SEH50402.1 2-dehydro-3-deoxyphosphogluconate aldolase / (4S)-4-hydroxy-2-oxoglutarate aldolase [Halobacillus karajensis]
MNLLDRLKEKRVIPVIRKAEEENILPITEALINGGITAIEITAETPKAATLIRKVAEAYRGRVLVGAGTVLDPETAMEMMRSGADFIVSPTLNVETISTCNRYGIPSIPGVFTPTEIQTAMEAGALMVKLFPANIVGPDYIKNVKGPLPQASIMATGGIHLDNMEEYLAKGAEVVGVGSQLVKTANLNTEADYRNLTNLAKAYTERAAVSSGEISI